MIPVDPVPESVSHDPAASLPATLPPVPLQPSAPHGRFDAAAQRLFIETLAETGSVKAAAARAGVSRMTAYRYRHAADAHAFREGWAEALARATTMLADVALARAIDGVEEPVFWRGEEVGTRTRYNDRLLMFLLRERWLYNPSYAPDPLRWHETVPRHTVAGYADALAAIAKAPGAAGATGSDAQGSLARKRGAGARPPARKAGVRKRKGSETRSHV